MTKAELQAELEELGIEFTLRETKAELEAKLQEAQVGEEFSAPVEGKSYGVSPVEE